MKRLYRGSGTPYGEAGISSRESCHHAEPRGKERDCGALEVGLPKVDHDSEEPSSWTGCMLRQACWTWTWTQPIQDKWRGFRKSRVRGDLPGLEDWPWLPPHQTYGVWQDDQRILELLSHTAATSCTFRAARASADPARSAGTSASACCWPGSSCFSVSSRG